MRVLVTGAGGFVGRKVCEHFSRENDVVRFTRTELDITTDTAVKDVIAHEQPDLIVNCAVLGIETCETDPTKARAINLDGPTNLAKAAEKLGAAIVHFSTNYVFDGSRNSDFYSIDDKPRPVSVYGQTKWRGEQAVVNCCERSFIIRTSWVYGGGSKGFFENAIASLRQGEKVQGIADNWASTTFVGDLVDRVAEIVLRGRYGTYQVVNDGVCSKYEFAVEAARLLGKNPDGMVLPVNACQSLSTKRPRYTPMECKLSKGSGLPKMRDWQNALAEYLRH